MHPPRCRACLHTPCTCNACMLCITWSCIVKSCSPPRDCADSSMCYAIATSCHWDCCSDLDEPLLRAGLTSSRSTPPRWSMCAAHSALMRTPWHAQAQAWCRASCWRCRYVLMQDSCRPPAACIPPCAPTSYHSTFTASKFTNLVSVSPLMHMSTHTTLPAQPCHTLPSCAAQPTTCPFCMPYTTTLTPCAT